MAADTQKTRKRQLNRRMWIAAAVVAGVLAGTWAVDRATADWGVCAAAEADTEQALKALAMFGRDDPWLRRELADRKAAELEACG